MRFLQSRRCYGGCRLPLACSRGAYRAMVRRRGRDRPGTVARVSVPSCGHCISTGATEEMSRNIFGVSTVSTYVFDTPAQQWVDWKVSASSSVFCFFLWTLVRICAFRIARGQSVDTVVRFASFLLLVCFSQCEYIYRCFLKSYRAMDGVNYFSISLRELNAGLLTRGLTVSYFPALMAKV